MGAERRDCAVEELLAQTGWLQSLARRLAGDATLADDAVQDTWMAAMRRPPEAGAPARPWLATVLRNALRMRARSDGRRARREHEHELALPRDEVPTPEALVAKAEAQRALADLVLRLDEPYRSTVLLHFCEGMSLADIARAEGIASGTARWRLKIALDQLRAWLDADPGDRRARVLIPLAALPKGALVAHKSSKLIAAVLILLALLAGVGLYLGSPDGDDSGEGATENRAHKPTADRVGSPDDMTAAGPAWLSQPGVAPRRVAGRVTFGGTPVPGATVELASLASEADAVAAPRRTTDAAGRFDFGLQPAMEWSVRASAPGKTGAALELDLRNPVLAPPPDELAIELGPCEAAMIGTVRDASGGAIAGARLARLVIGREARVPGGVAAVTDAAGAYELCLERMWPGRVVAEVSADGYGAIVYTGLVLGRVQVDFALVPEGVIAGRVVRDDTGEPVAMAHVFLPQGPWGIESTSWRGTFTDRAGRFRIDRVAPGRHIVLARAEGMVGSTRGTPVLVEAGRTTEDVEIRLQPASVVRGVVLEGGAPVAGARVAAVAVDGVRSTRSAISQTDGSFALEEVPRGEVRFTAWPYQVVSPTAFRIERDDHDGVVLVVEPLGAIVGRVVRGSRPVPGARVHIHGPNEYELESVRTDADGRFEARGLQPGPWTLFGEDERGGRFGRAPETVELARGQTAQVTIDLAYGAAIAGTVVDQDGAPVPGLSVQFWHTTIEDVGMAVTSLDGSFRAAAMTGGGSYRTTVRPYQGSPVALRPATGTEFPSITLADGDAEVTGVTIAVQLDRLAIAGQVVDTSGAPVPDARVVAAMVADGAQPSFLRWVHHAAATTDVDGRFSIGELPAGTYALEARAPSGAQAVLGGVRAGRADVVLTLPSPGAIEGELVGFTQAPQVSAMRTDAGGSAVPSDGTVAQSSFAVRNLSPGTYVVTARTATEAAAARVTVAPGATARVTLASGGSGTVTGRVRDFRTGKAIEGMTCRAQPRVGTAPTTGFAGEGARTDAQGAFTLDAAPAGDLVVACIGLWHLYSDGLRMIELPRDGTVDVDVPVVAWNEGVAPELAGFGADIDVIDSLVPVLIDVRPDGAAAAAGFRSGDRVTAVDGVSVTELSPRGVRMLITNRPPGMTVTLTISRGGQTHTADVVTTEYDLP